MAYSGDDRTPDSSYFTFMEFLPADTMTTIDAEMQRMWHWTAEPCGLPPMYDQLLTKTNKCQISNKRSMYHKVFCGRYFKLGGNKQ